MAKIEHIKNKRGEVIYPVSKEGAIYDENGVLLSTKIATFITRLVDNLANYYLKSETYTKAEVDELIGAIQGFTYIVVSELPTASAETMGIVYLVPSGDPQAQNVKDEYITIRSGVEGSYTYSWEQIGSTAIDLSGYVTTEALNTALANYTTTANLTTLLAAKQDTIADLSTIRSGAAAGATAYQKPNSGIPASDIASGVIPTVPTISTDISTDAASDAKTASPKAVKTYVDNGIAAVVSDLSDLADEVESIDIGAYDVAWDGNSEPVVANIPAGVTVTYNTTTYTGELAASASTNQKIYLVATGTTDNYDRYITVGDSTYSWVNLGTTEITLADYATKAEVSQLEAKVDGIDLVFSSYTKTFNIIITGNTWYARGTHRVIPVTPGEQYRLKPTGADTNYAWLTASYDPSQITGAAPVLSGTTIVSVTNGEEVIVVVPTGAAYLYLMNETSNWTVVSWTIRRLGENEILAMRLDDVEEVTESLTDKPIDFDSLPTNTKTISGTNWYSSGTHRVMPVTPGDVLLIKSILHDSDYAWLTSSYDPSAPAGSAAPIVPNTERYTAVMGESIKITAPENAAYLYLVNENGGWQTQSWEITKLGEITQIDSRLDAIEDTTGNLVTKAVNVSDINASNYVIGTDGNWYSKGQHRVIPVNPGETFSIKTIGRDSNYYFLTDAYTPPATYGSAAPIVAGTQRNDIVADKEYIFRIPNGTAYLYFVKEDGGWNPITIELTKIGEIDAINERVSAIEDNLPSGTLLPYYGEKITLSPVYGLRKVSGVTARLNGTLYPQGMAVYGGYMFRVYDTGQCEIYDITGDVPSLVETFALACVSETPHCNSVQFANEVESGDFPYLYVSACKTDARKCYVVSVDLEGNSQLIQTITFAEMDALPSGIAMNTTVGEDGYLWVSGYKGTTLYFAKFELPATDAGDLTIGASSLVDSWQVADYDYDNNVCQGMHVSVGRLYYAYGGQFNNRGIWVYDTVQKKKVSELKMNDTTSVEFEDVAVYDGKMYLELVADYYFVLTF